MRIRKQITLALLALAATAHATNYFAAPNAQGSGLTATEPGNVTLLRNKLAAGDSLFLLPGQYDLSETLTFGKSGTEQQRVYIGARGEGEVILDFRRQAYKQNGVKLSGDYIHIQGITIRYAGFKGLINQGSYNIMEQLVAYGNSDTGIQQRDGGYNLIKNCDSYDNFDYQTMKKDGVTKDYGGNADGFADKKFSGAGNTYIGCRAWNNSDDGWDFYERVTTEGATVFIGCVCYANGPKEYNMKQHPRYETDKDWFDKAGENPEHYTNYGNGNGFKVGGNKTAHNVSMYRCLSVANTVKGFDQNNNAGIIKIVNCTAYANQKNYGFGNNTDMLMTITNSISLEGREKDSFLKDHVMASNNSWQKGYEATRLDFENLNYKKLILAPREADGSLPETKLLRLRWSAANLVDKGRVVAGFDGIQTWYDGDAPDLGCFEMVTKKKK